MSHQKPMTIWRKCLRMKKGMIRMNNSMVNRPDVDAEHTIELKEMNAKIFFLKNSESNSLKKAQSLLLDAYENRICCA